MKVIKQLLKEFFLPFLVALIWTFLNHSKANTEQNWILNDAKNFGAAFFLVSWFGGQIFRVIKQQKTESSFSNLISRLENVSSTLEKGLIDFKGFAIGGDSYCYLDINRLKDGKFLIGLINNGKYPLYDIQVSLQNLNDDTHTDITKRPTEHIGSLPSGMVTHIDIDSESDDYEFRFIDNEENYLKYIARIYCRNGNFEQDIRVIKFENEWHTATRLRKGDEILLTRTTDSFPLKNPFD